MTSRSEDWFEQAKRDLEAAQGMRREGNFEWAAFAARQAAEKALKSVPQSRGKTAWGHAVVGLLRALGEEDLVDVPGALHGCGHTLDRSYIGARYPNRWPEGPPYTHYEERDADEAIDCAGTILRFRSGLLVR